MTPYARYTYTTGKVASICKVSPRTVSKWIDSGLMRGYRVPPGRDRRVMGSALREFMLAHKMSELIPLELRQEFPVCVFGYALPSHLAPGLENAPGARVVFTQFELALAIAELRTYPVAVYLGTVFGFSSALETAHAILDSRTTLAPDHTYVSLAYSSEDTEVHSAITDSRIVYARCDSAEQLRALVAHRVNGSKS